MTSSGPVHHDFVIDRRYRWLLRAFGVSAPQDAFVDLGDDTLAVRFGYWSLSTPVTNLAGAEVVGPFSAPKVLGVHLSIADRGVTFGSNTGGGACLRFHRPVPGIEPLGLLRHPGATVTVADPDALVEAVRQRTGPDRAR